MSPLIILWMGGHLGHKLWLLNVREAPQEVHHSFQMTNSIMDTCKAAVFKVKLQVQGNDQHLTITCNGQDGPETTAPNSLRVVQLSMWLRTAWASKKRFHQNTILHAKHCNHESCHDASSPGEFEMKRIRASGLGMRIVKEGPQPCTGLARLALMNHQVSH
jgi:hypothetical protein